MLVRSSCDKKLHLISDRSVYVNILLGPDNMYVYEGEDYSKCSDEDKKSFDQLLAGMWNVEENTV